MRRNAWVELPGPARSCLLPASGKAGQGLGYTEQLGRQSAGTETMRQVTVPSMPCRFPSDKGTSSLDLGSESERNNKTKSPTSLVFAKDCLAT